MACSKHFSLFAVFLFVSFDLCAESYDFSYPSIASAYFEDLSADHKIGTGGVYVRPASGDLTIASNIIGGFRHISPLTIFSAVNVEKVIALRDKGFITASTKVGAVLPGETKFLAGDIGKLVRKAMPEGMFALSLIGERAFGLICDVAFIKLIRTFNYNLTNKICADLSRAHFIRNNFASKKMTMGEIRTLCYKAGFERCDQAAITGAFIQLVRDASAHELLAYFTSGAHYSETFHGATSDIEGCVRDIAFEPRQDESHLMYDDIFSEINSRVIIGRLFSFYVFYAYCCSSFFGFDVNPENNVVFGVLDLLICKFASEVLRRGAECTWVKDALKESDLVMPVNPSKAAAAA